MNILEGAFENTVSLSGTTILPSTLADIGALAFSNSGDAAFELSYPATTLIQANSFDNMPGTVTTY
jgi:hypothetical protein